MKIYLALYNPCIHESGYVTLSLHKTKEGAQKVIDKHRKRNSLDWDNMIKGEEEDWADMKFDDYIDYDIQEQEVLD